MTTVPVRRFDGPISEYKHGPGSFLFYPLRLQLRWGACPAPAEAAALSPKIAPPLLTAHSGSCFCWAIAIEVGEALVIREGPVGVEMQPLKASWLAFLHTLDIRPLEPGPGRQGERT